MKSIRSIVLAGMMTLIACGTTLAGNVPQHAESRTIHGTVEKMPIGLYGAWIIDGRRVLVSPYTRVEQNNGLATKGSHAEIDGVVKGGTFRATLVRITPGGKLLAAEESGLRHQSDNF